ncbi:DUF317 domain-containing protein [Streptomyces celluloflavus]|uniref:DUF317 domain-containing protein n=1 Tax=Streptomyces celluloflavus TaxID=58344 RepID=UPI003461508F|nr:DUF317 domain-containing protein [Streptomyces celluloflavus]
MTHPYIATRANEPHNTIWFETRPRHLAGRGDPRLITQTLRAAGWKNHSDPDYPHVILASRDYRHTLVLEPEPKSYAPWWRISSQGDGQHWYARFGGNTPVEILAGYTDALIRPAPETEQEVWPELTSAGWSYECDERGNETARHPDGIMSLRRWTTEEGKRFYWTAEAVVASGLGGQQRVWDASFDDDTPRHLIAAFATALASDKPVQRGRYDVPHSHLVTQEQRGPLGERLADAHEARLKAARAAARKARRTAALQTSNAPVPTAPAAPARSR